MVREDFIEESYGYFISKDKFLFKNDEVEFYYKWLVIEFNYPANWFGDRNTRYNVRILIDSESRHESKKDTFLEQQLYVFDMMKKEIRNTYKKPYDINKIFDKIDELKNKIESKIKVNKYQKIKAILFGGTFQVRLI